MNESNFSNISIGSNKTPKNAKSPSGKFDVSVLSPTTQAYLGNMTGSTNYEIKVQKKINREKLLEFEKEIAKKLQYLQQIEKDMNDINEKRVEWLKNISFHQVSGTSNFNLKVQLIKHQASLISNQLKMDVLRLESQIESLKLSTLVDGTRALEYGETLEKRELEMFLKGKSDLDIMKHTLQSSIDYRIQLSNYLYQLLSNLKELQVTAKKDTEVNLQNIHHHLNLFRAQMKSFQSNANMNYQSIVKDYLVLRHNANVIQEIIVRNRNQYTNHRAIISKDLEKLIHTAKEKQTKIEVLNSNEIVSLTNNLREEILNKEKILEDLIREIVLLKKEKFQNYQSIIKEIMKYEKGTILVEKKRKDEIDSVYYELQHLRHTIKGLEDHLYSGVPLENLEPFHMSAPAGYQAKNASASQSLPSHDEDMEDDSLKSFSEDPRDQQPPETNA
jgi:hypothetical protein